MKHPKDLHYYLSPDPQGFGGYEIVIVETSICINKDSASLAFVVNDFSMGDGDGHGANILDTSVEIDRTTYNNVFQMFKELSSDCLRIVENNTLECGLKKKIGDCFCRNGCIYKIVGIDSNDYIVSGITIDDYDLIIDEVPDEAKPLDLDSDFINEAPIIAEELYLQVE